MGRFEIGSVACKSLPLFILATLPILFGAVQPWVWFFYTVCIFAAFIILLWQKNGFQNQIFDKLVTVFVGIFFAATLLQLMPLPEGLLRFFSLHQYKVFDAARELIGQPSSARPLSYNPQASLAWWLFLLSLVLFFLILRSTLKDRRYLHTVLWLLFGLTSVEALYGILQALVPNLGVLWVDYITAYLGDARGTYINRNHFTGFMEMMIPLMLGFTLSREGWETKIGMKSFFCIGPAPAPVKAQTRNPMIIRRSSNLRYLIFRNIFSGTPFFMLIVQD